MMISKKQKQFLKNILPNTEVFVNKLIDWPINNLDYLTCKNYKIVMTHLDNLGCYIPKGINTSNYELTWIGSHNKIDVFRQKNIYKNSVLKVIRLEDIMVLDLDGKDVDEVCSYLKNARNLNFKLYKTTNGYHAYCVNKFFNHRDYNTLQLMKDLHCDLIYINFCAVYGFIIRAQKKTGEEPFIEHFERYFLNVKENNLLEIESILDQKDKLIGTLSSTQSCLL